MSKLHFPRKNISLDMTAMCDVAFLLLTFFMLATKFKPDEPVIVDTPTSVSEIKLPESDVVTITIDRDGAIFFGIDNQRTRARLIDEMDRKYSVGLSAREKEAFTLTSSIGVPVGNLKEVLALPADEQRSLDQPGIPADSAHNELRDWVDLARRLNDRPPRVALKGDQDVDYEIVKRVIDTLQELNVNRFNMITSLEAPPDGDPAPDAEASSQR